MPQLVSQGYQRRTAREARSTLTTIPWHAIPRYIQMNPAARKRGKGRKGQRRIERAEKAEKSWPNALESLLFAEQCAVLYGRDADFVLCITAYTGMRWSEVMGLPPECIHKGHAGHSLEALRARRPFYRGYPKDGSMRVADLPSFLADLLACHLDATPHRKCTCRNTEEPWRSGGEYVFLGQQNAHHGRSNYGTRIVRPAADGWHPKRAGRYDGPPRRSWWIRARRGPVYLCLRGHRPCPASRTARRLAVGYPG